jgi:hypothetical protein
MRMLLSCMYVYFQFISCTPLELITCVLRMEFFRSIFNQLPSLAHYVGTSSTLLDNHHHQQHQYHLCLQKSPCDSSRNGNQLLAT